MQLGIMDDTIPHMINNLCDVHIRIEYPNQLPTDEIC